MIPELVATRLISQLNSQQQAAIRKVLSARDYALILAMPATGKATVVAAMIKILVSMRKTVLLVSRTNSPLDAILLELKAEANFGILRLGSLDEASHYRLSRLNDMFLNPLNRYILKYMASLSQHVLLPLSNNWNSK